MKQRRGYVLLAALSLTMAISMVALAAATEARMRRTAVRNAHHIALSRKAAESALSNAVAALTDAISNPLAIDTWRELHGRTLSYRAANARAVATIIDAESVMDSTMTGAGRINLNTADANTLTQVAGVSGA
ncbi:MAG TPA: hypothetical protein VGD49_13855, partial [Longimicrobiales bacterium]